MGFFRFALVTLLASAGLLFLAFSVFVPLQVDSGWYTYPALSLSEGRDAGENQSALEELLAEKPGRKAKFYWDSRHNLYVLPTRGWFELFGTSVRSIHAYGMLQFLIFAAVSGMLFLRRGGGGAAAAACWAVLCADSVIIGNAATDARPDVFLAVLAMILFLALTDLLERREVRPLSLAAGICAAIILPLYHLTSLAAVICFAAFAILRMRRGAVSRKNASLVVLCLAIFSTIFVFRVLILDVLIPTNVSETFVQNPYVMLIEKFAGSAVRPFAVELARWRGYAWPSNAVLILIPAAAIIAVRRQKSTGTYDPLGFDLFLSVLCGIAVIIACSPSPRVDHLITLMPFLLLASSRLLAGSARSWAAVLLIAALLKLTHAGYVLERFGNRANMQNSAIEELFAGLVPRDRPVLIVGPTEIWPYVPSDRNVVIDDHRNGMFDFSHEWWKRVDYVVLNREYENYRWRERFAEHFPQLRLIEVRYLGEREEEREGGGKTSGPFIGVYRVAPIT